MNEICLEYLSASEADPIRLAHIAKANDCRLISVKLGPTEDVVHRNLVHDAAARRAFKDVCEDLGVSVDLIESLNVLPDTDLAQYRPMFEVGAFLGAPQINAQLRRDDNLQRGLDHLAEVCAMAAEYDMEVVLEISRAGLAREPWGMVELLKRANLPNVRMMIDVMHFLRFGQTLDGLAELGPWIGRAQLCDGPAIAPQDQLWEAVHERLPPGEGDFPLKEFLAAMPDGITIGVEVPQDAKQAAGVDAETRVAHMMACARRVMGQAA